MQKFGLVVIGAHIGAHIQPDIEEYKNKKILLVEPVPHNLRILKENVGDYDTIKIEPVTIGKENKIINMIKNISQLFINFALIFLSYTK